MKSSYRRFRQLALESFESRLVPASATVTYTDLDGDLVRVTASLPNTLSVPPLDASDLAFVSGGANGLLRTLTLTESGFDGANIVFTVTKKPGGDGLAHVGFIDAIGVDLGRVVVNGDLGKIVAGDAVTLNDPGLNLLQARSMGTLGLYTQGLFADLNSVITGRLGALRVRGDFTDAFLNVIGGADGQIGSVFIGGDLTGGADLNSGRVECDGAIGNTLIGGSVIGGAGTNSGVVFSLGVIGNVLIGGNVTGGASFGSGQVQSNGTMGNVLIGGSVTGGADDFSGRVKSSSTMGNVRIGRSITGGAGTNSGQINSSSTMGNVLIGGSVTGRADNSGQVYSGGTIGNVLIGGSITGGAGFASGLVFSNGAMGNVRIGGDLIGGSITGADSLDGSGAVISDGRIASATIGGSLIAGVDASIGALTKSGAIIAGDDIGPIRIGGSILGNSTNPARIIARGKEVKPATGFDVAIASLTVRGDVRFAGILAGFDDDQNPANADASIGRVIVGRDWVASDLVAGAQDAGAAGFGAGDVLQAAGDTGLVARIAGITIWGTVTSSFPILDRFGFVAEQIDALRFGSTVFSLDPGPSNDDAAIPFTFGVRLLEVS